MVVYSVQSETEWNTLRRLVAATPLIAGDIVRIDASFSVGNVSSAGLALNIGAATVNGYASGTQNVLTFWCDKVTTLAPFIMAGGTITNLTVDARGSDVWSSGDVVAGGGSACLLQNGSYGTVRDCYIACNGDVYNAGIIRDLEAGKTLTVQDTYVVTSSISSVLFAAYVYQVVSTGSLTLSNCTASMTGLANNVNGFSLLPYLMYGYLSVPGTNSSNGVRGQANTVGTAVLTGQFYPGSTYSVNYVYLKTSNVTTTSVGTLNGTGTFANYTTSGGSVPDKTMTSYTDAGGMLSSSPSTGHTWHGLGLSVSAQTTITSVTDWTDLVTATATTPLVSGQTIRLANNLTFVAAPGGLSIGAGTFDGYGYTVTLFYPGSLHAPLFSCTGGLVSNVIIVNTFLSSSSTAVVSTEGSYGTFSYIQLTGNALSAGVVLRGVTSQTTLIKCCSFVGYIFDSHSGGMFCTSSNDLFSKAYVGGATGIVFTVQNCTSTASLFGTAQKGGLGAYLAGPGNGGSTSHITGTITGCRVYIPYVEDNGYMGAIVESFTGGMIEKTYATSNSQAHLYFICEVTQYVTGAVTLRNCYYKNLAGSATNFFILGLVSYSGTITLQSLYHACDTTAYFVQTKVVSLVLTKIYRTTSSGGIQSNSGGTTTGSFQNLSLIYGSGGAATISS